MAIWLAASLLLQLPSDGPPSAHRIREAGHDRVTDTLFWRAALAAPDGVRRRLALREIGRVGRSVVPDATRPASLAIPFLEDPDPATRRAAAFAVHGAEDAVAWPRLLAGERDATVRGAFHDARAASARPGLDTLLARGLDDPAPAARLGAARGLVRALRRAPQVRGRALAERYALLVPAARRAMLRNDGAESRQLLLGALAALDEADGAILAAALRDTSALVRRLGVAIGKRWVDDPSPIVRVEALRAAGRCPQLARAVHDADEHVALVAVELLGPRGCDARLADSLARAGATWRVQARAVAALATLDTARVAPHLARLAASPTWQARAWAAGVARRVRDTATLARLARDREPMVAAAALVRPADVIAALGRDEAGLVHAAAEALRRSPALPDAVPALLAAFARQQALPGAWRRDARLALLERLEEHGDTARIAAVVRPALADPDPLVAHAAARALGAIPVDTTAPRGRRLPPPRTGRWPTEPFPDAATLAGLVGTRLVVTVRDLGVVELELLVDEAPATVASVVALARAGAYDGRTFHRVEPNFVLQGGSPAANEYDGLTPRFMRDELGGARHRRGTWGISTRGRDTGDGQFFVNLVDNYRLDDDYTVFARTVRGLAVLDRVQEGAVIDRVEVVPRR